MSTWSFKVASDTFQARRIHNTTSQAAIQHRVHPNVHINVYLEYLVSITLTTGSPPDKSHHALMPSASTDTSTTC